jgi:hypothetical protein
MIKIWTIYNILEMQSMFSHFLEKQPHDLLTRQKARVETFFADSPKAAASPSPGHSYSTTLLQ